MHLVVSMLLTCHAYSALETHCVQAELKMTVNALIVRAILIAGFTGGNLEQYGKDAGHSGEGWLLTLRACLPPGLAAQWPAGGILFVPEFCACAPNLECEELGWPQKEEEPSHAADSNL